MKNDKTARPLCEMLAAPPRSCGEGHCSDADIACRRCQDAWGFRPTFSTQSYARARASRRAEIVGMGCACSSTAAAHGRVERDAAVAVLESYDMNHLRAIAKDHPETRFGFHCRDIVCRVLKVYDADSVTVSWADPRSPIGVVYSNVRLWGVDAPELMRPSCEEERQCAIHCRNAVSDLVLGCCLRMSSAGKTPSGLDKYGRPLVTLCASDSGETSSRVVSTLLPFGGSLNEWIVQTLPACVQYSGGSKIPFDKRACELRTVPRKQATRK